MTFLADENIDASIVARLRSDGHKILSVLEMKPGISDDEILEIAKNEKAILITSDKDFGELVFRQDRIVCGVILTRISWISSAERIELISKIIREHQNELSNNFTVVTPWSLRIRKIISLE